MTTLADKLGKRWEAHHPPLIGALGFFVFLVFGTRLFAFAKASNWKIDQIYTCVFTLSTVFTAFLFTFYTFVVTAERGFLGKARGSIYFGQIVAFTISAIIVGAVLCLATVPLLVVQPVPDKLNAWLIYSALWISLTLWATASFIRASYLFVILARNQN